MQFVIIATFHTFFKTMLFARSLQCGIEIGVGLLKDSMNTMVSLTGAVSVTWDNEGEMQLIQQWDMQLVCVCRFSVLGVLTVYEALVSCYIHQKISLVEHNNSPINKHTKH